jgi:hypothetical protein
LSEPLDTFATPPAEARHAAIALVEHTLCHESAKLPVEPAWYGPFIHAALTLCRGLAARLRTPAAMALIDGWFHDVAADDIPDDPDRRLAAALVAAHLQTSPTPPDDDAAIALHNLGAENFNAALEATDKAERFQTVFLRALNLWAHLLPEANGLAGVAVLNDVAAELWPDQ